ncbi:hypothetical protein CsatA_021544 [Cannabis sativa]
MALAFVMTTVLWLFMPDLMRLEVDVKAHREMIGFLDTIKIKKYCLLFLKLKY